MNSSKSVIVVAPGNSSGSILEILDAMVLSTQTNIEVLLPPELLLQYNILTDRKTTLGKARFVTSPARHFFSARHFEWLRGNLRSSENVMVVIRQSPYEDLASALTSLLIMLLSGKSITLLRTIIPDHEPILDLEGQNSGEHVISRELNLKSLGKQYMQLFPTIWEILYFTMFLALIIKRLLVNHCLSSARTP